MAFDENLAVRIRAHLGKRTGVAERKMFGGIIFVLRGNMCCGVHRDALIVRLGADEARAALAEPHTRVFDLTGRPMKACCASRQAPRRSSMLGWQQARMRSLAHVATMGVVGLLAAACGSGSEVPTSPLDIRFAPSDTGTVYGQVVAPGGPTHRFGAPVAGATVELGTWRGSAREFRDAQPLP